MTSHLTKDIAPGEPHISWRAKGVSYYTPALFHMAPTHERVVPLTILDLKRSRSMLEIYGVQGLQKHAEGYILVKNFPVRTVRVAGRIVQCVHKEGYLASGFPYSFYLVYIDDFLGDNLCICARVDGPLMPQTMAAHEDLLLEVTGTVSYFKDYSKQLTAKSARILGRFDDLEVELLWWATVLETRKFLQSPWSYEAPTRENGTEPVEGFSRRDFYKRLEKRTILILDSDDDSDSDSPSAYLSADDSFPLHQEAILERKEQRSDSSNSDMEIVEIASMDTDLAEIPILLSFRTETVIESQDIVDLTDD